MENKIWEANLEALEEMLPGWKEHIQSEGYKETKEYKERQVVQIHLEESYSGERISRVENEQGSYYLAGKYHPQGMAERVAKKIKDADFGTVVFVIGISDGRVLRELVRNVSKDAMIFLYEPSMDIFLHTLKEYPLEDIFKEHTIGFVIDGINGEELENVMNLVINVENMSKVKPVIQGNYEMLFPKQVKKAVNLLKKRVEALRFHWNTCVEFTNETIINCIKNVKYVYEHYSMNALYGTLSENIPVIVVAAGPSLDKNIELLAEAKGKACIIACDTALKPLLRRGIVPDFFVVVDPRKPLELFEHPEIANIPMISGLNIPYQIMEQHKGKKVLYFDSWIISELLEKVIPAEKRNLKNAMYGVATGGSVATSAFSVGKLMGAKIIILIGQDLALSGEKEHAEGTFQKDRKFDLKNQALPRVEGIDGEMLPTLHNLKLYLEWFEKQIEKDDSVKVVDATEGGALIHGSEVLTLRETIERYCKTEYDSEVYWENIEKHFDKEEKEKALAFFHELPEQLEKIKKQVIQGKKLYTKLEKSVSKENYSLKELKKLLKKIKSMNETLEKNSLAMLIIDGLAGVEYTLRASAYQFQGDEKKDLIESAKSGQHYLESIKIAINEVMPEIIKLSEFQGEY